MFKMSKKATTIVLGMSLSIMFAVIGFLFSGYAYHAIDNAGRGTIAALLIAIFLLFAVYVANEFSQTFKSDKKAAAAIAASLVFGILLMSGINHYMGLKACKAKCTSIKQDEDRLYCEELNGLKIEIPISPQYNKCEAHEPNKCSVKDKKLLLDIKKCDASNKTDNVIEDGYIKCKFSFNLKGSGIERNVTMGELVKIINYDNFEEIEDTTCL